MNKKYIILIIIVVGIIFITFLSFNGSSNVKETEVIALESNNISKEEKIDKVVVDIKGAIKKPGIYEIDSTKRVNDVIKLAGGLNKDANTNYINLSMKVKDEMVIWIYTNSEIKKMKLQTTSTEYMIKECNCPTFDNTACLNNEVSNNNGLININTATIEQITTLSGIGESKAKAIIEYRTKNGPFKTQEDIMNVSGIGESAYNKIKDSITV